MRLEIFQKALLATARVACCASLLAACQKPDDKVSEPLGAQNQPESQPESSPTAPMSLGECKTHTAAVFTAKTEAKNEETGACCQLIAADYDKNDVMAGQNKWPERSGCCSLLGWNGSVACTPWGPPCPPTMGIA